MSGLRRPFLPLAVPNFRRFYAGQLVSLSGTWIQTVAELWLVLSLTGSGVSLGMTTALQFTPMLVLAPWAGLLADRLPKRRVLIVTQAAMAIPAVSLFALTATGSVELWMVYALVFLRGAGTAVDHPVRQAFVMEMVGPEHLAAAVSLNAALVSSARMIGPAVGGVLIATTGVAPCFAVNAASFGAAVWALVGMDPGELRPAPPAGRARGQLRGALRYVAATPDLRGPLAAMAVAGTLAFNFPVVLPLLARYTFERGAAGYGALAAAMGGGAIAGALAVAARRRPPRQSDVPALAIAFGLTMALAASAPTLPLAMAALVPVGAASIAYAATTNAVLQLAVSPGMRGRVMALYSVLLLGSAPVGGPFVGWVSGQAGARAGLLVGAGAAIVAAAAATLGSSREHDTDGPRARSPQPRRGDRGRAPAAGLERRGSGAQRGHAGEPARARRAGDRG